ncbi:uncharacterized protein HMPREF1541_02401 [Cyphellophora europaea CBS 101466]|uniref:Chromatin modification-related protein n=1 Tax=Cyphellophora europaea (strain CBS 101466) TaxID=1220924 RepID=W2S3H6_CYPE1|nr:uncharacterized protein HMPREF1541_02401 [Cyphellophora europaea CBS 101466]ETN43242.1 hypothetical protein HMPREF1541_02401 [Cyphellophora europaea CBS 101466]
MATTYTTVLGTSNLRGNSRTTRTNPTRTSKTQGSTLRQNSLISNPPPSVQGGSEPHGFYPAIQHFSDAITALPRDYRRHTSLLKEVDAKAWQPEENLQKLLEHSKADKPTAPLPIMPPSTAASTTNLTDEPHISAANSVTGVPADAVSQLSKQSSSSTTPNRRQVFAALRHNLVQLMVTMDEKNHVINNANEELSRQVRRLNTVWPHIADEISEEARLGSLKHWAYTDINPTKKTTAPTTRREAAASLALIHDNEVAQRSESRREAVAAKAKQRLHRNEAVEGSEDVRATKKKAIKETQRRDLDSASEVAGLGITAKGKKAAKAVGGGAMEKSMSAALGGRAMSREPSQQDNTKKRKAPAGGATVARKRVNAAQDSPKLASSPLAGTFGKDAYKRSPALGTVRPVSARARQNSSQAETSRAKPPSSSSSQRAPSGLASSSAPDVKSTAAAPGKSNSEAKNNAKESTNARRDRILEDETASNGDASALLERRASKTKPDLDKLSTRANSPRPSVMALNMDRVGRGRASKTSTPVVGSFGDADSSSANGNGASHHNSKNKRLVRPRAQYDGLHDSLSPKGLPAKRMHKKSGSIAAPQSSQQMAARMKEEAENQMMMMSTTTSATPDEMEVGGGEEEGEEGEEEGADEERYCYCQTGSYGEMVACDNEQCPREWFHLECIGLKSVPKSAKWYCDECKALGLGGSNGGGGGAKSGRVNGNGGGR